MGSPLRPLSPREELIAELEELGYDAWSDAPKDWRETNSDMELRAEIDARTRPLFSEPVVSMSACREIISELTAVIEQAEAALAEGQKMLCGNDFTDDRSLFQSTPFYAPLRACRDILSDIRNAQEAFK